MSNEESWIEWYTPGMRVIGDRERLDIMRNDSVHDYHPDYLKVINEFVAPLGLVLRTQTKLTRWDKHDRPRLEMYVRPELLEVEYEDLPPIRTPKLLKPIEA